MPIEYESHYFLPLQPEVGDGRTLVYRFVSHDDPGGAEPEVKIRAENESGDVALRPHSLSRHVDDPWIWTASAGIPADTRKVLVDAVLNGDSVSRTLDVDTPAASVAVNTKTKATVKSDAPTISTALNSMAVLEPEAAPAGDADAVNAILAHIWRRLEKRVDKVWVGPWYEDANARDPGQVFGPQSRFMTPLDQLDEVVQPWGPTPEQQEEQWARMISEMLTAVPYGNPWVAYFGKPDGLKLVYRKMQDRTDPAYPLATACQQSCDIAIISRGFDLLPPGNDNVQTCDCSIVTKEVVERLGGTWHGAASKRIAKLDVPNCEIAPGSMYTFSSPRHIAFLIRVDAQNKRMQFLDTGAMMTGRQEEASRLPEGMRDIFRTVRDYPWYERVVLPGKTYVGLGVLPTPPDLAEGNARMRRARPLGLARLFLKKGDELLLRTPILRMHADPAHLNFAISTMIWSLRMMPARDRITATWELDFPRAKLAELLVRTDINGRATKVPEMLALVHTIPGDAGKDNRVRLPFLDVQSRPDGKTKVITCHPVQLDPSKPKGTKPRVGKNHKPTAAEWLEPEGTVAEAIWARSDPHLNYFKGTF